MKAKEEKRFWNKSARRSRRRRTGKFNPDSEFVQRAIEEFSARGGCIEIVEGLKADRCVYSGGFGQGGKNVYNFLRGNEL